MEGSSRNEEAADLYVKAGNSFKIAKKWSAAGDAFSRAAVLQLKLDSKHEAASHYVEAGNCFRKTDADEAVNSLLKAIEIYTDMGQFSIAAKHHMTVGDIYGTDRIDLEKAIVHYQQAADFYRGEESSSSANKNLLKVVQYSAQLEKYEKAISIYEQVGMSAMDNQLLRYSAKDHFFRAVICRLCHYDFEDARNSLARYVASFPNLQDSRECKLLKALIAAVEEQNENSFVEAVKVYNNMSRLDSWCTMILAKIKKTIAFSKRDNHLM